MRKSRTWLVNNVGLNIKGLDKKNMYKVLTLNKICKKF